MRIGEAIIKDATKVTKSWTKYQERRIRSYGRATWTPPRVKKVTIKDIAWRIMPEAYKKAAGGVGMCAPRQIFYVARPMILDELDDEKDVNSVYFTQTLLPDFMSGHPSETAGWDIIWDERGHFREPHTDKEIGLGTLAVRNYLAAGRNGADTTLELLKTRYPTLGPRHRFANVLLIEKEGFQQIFEHVGLDTRYDLAIMSSKGMNTTSARTLVEKLLGIRFLVLHDFDKAGCSILGTLTRSTRRYHFDRRADIVDLGIRLEDVNAEELPVRAGALPRRQRAQPASERREPRRDQFPRRRGAARRAKRVHERSADRMARGEVRGPRRREGHPSRRDVGGGVPAGRSRQQGQRRDREGARHC